MLEAADCRVYLPLRGFADSLNLSVATALVVQQVLHLSSPIKSTADHPYVARMLEDERQALREQWFPKLARQRLLTSRQKKEQKRLQQQVRQCRALMQQQQSSALKKVATHPGTMLQNRPTAAVRATAGGDGRPIERNRPGRRRRPDQTSAGSSHGFAKGRRPPRHVRGPQHQEKPRAALEIHARHGGAPVARHGHGGVLSKEGWSVKDQRRRMWLLACSGQGCQ